MAERSRFWGRPEGEAEKASRREGRVSQPAPSRRKSKGCWRTLPSSFFVLRFFSDEIVWGKKKKNLAFKTARDCPNRSAAARPISQEWLVSMKH